MFIYTTNIIDCEAYGPGGETWHYEPADEVKNPLRPELYQFSCIECKKEYKEFSKTIGSLPCYYIVERIQKDAKITDFFCSCDCSVMWYNKNKDYYNGK